MHHIAISFITYSAVASLAIGGCKDRSKVDSVKDKAGAKLDEIKDKVASAKRAFFDWTDDVKHDVQCKVMHSMMGRHDGIVAPGVAGAPRWGIPKARPATLRVRRSWSTLGDAEKKKVIDAFIALKRVTADSGKPGASRANYDSLCAAVGQPAYPRNLYDYYVEAHMNAFISMHTKAESMEQMSHMGPNFVAWHRYLLLRIEADLAEVSGDPGFALPYWDWQDCYKGGGTTPCPLVFQSEFLGSPGTCDDNKREVTGYLTDQGFRVNITTKGNNLFVPDSVVCNQMRPLHRQVGCVDLVKGPADATAVAGIFTRTVFDAEPYDFCNTEEDVSFRQYLEGYDNDSTNMTCTAVGCAMHSSGHIYTGADMYESSGSPNDPLFFLHHANVDRLWAAWQEANLAKRDAAAKADHGNPAYPAAYRGPLFIWNEVNATEMFDYQALGYRYDALPSPN